MRRVAALIVIGVLAAASMPAAYAQSADDDEEVAERTEAPGGYGYYDDSGTYSSRYDVFVERFGSYGNTPDFDNRSFWERVQSEPGSATVGVSGL